ncbi:MAG: DNA-3-methyladenine glycosylase [Candidatus Marinimicrobia bacterium]|jgi:DNA-3-methyladenine glycosylase|nr:DNA-3-methyladenine glycosylase [Candidatus Neomarinimicrobiota bacterium]MDX9777687.1 DNA-3-methyladenine glycosylase [bacterium]
MKYLSREFFMQDVRRVAEKLLDTWLIRDFPGGGRLIGRIVETEAYAHTDDPASHSSKGKTPRNAVMFGPAGHLYVYFTYGMHFCCNVVTAAEGRGEAVLLRALEPLEGIPRMALNRYGKENISERELKDLCRGPARLCRAFAIGREQNGTDLCGGEIRIGEGDAISKLPIARSSRIGIREGRSHLWRFYFQNDPWISGPVKDRLI